MTDVATLDAKVNDMILTGQALAAFEEFYGDNVVMIEPGEVHEGKDLNRTREEAFFASLEAFHGGELVSSAVNGNTTFSEWLWDVTFKGGPRVKMEQVAVRTWDAGKIVRERFYYNKG